jgi:hypothetical protein
MKKLALPIVMLVLSICTLARAQSFDLTNGRVPVASLDGLWRFHTGDDPAWADPNFDDLKWSLLRSDRDWSSQGFKIYSGMAWYRFQVVVPVGLDHVSLLLPSIATCYEVYADGSLIGTYGKMPPNTIPYSGGAHQRYRLPAGKRLGTGIEIALRVWHSPRFAKDGVGGGPRFGGGLVGDSSLVARENMNLQDAIKWILTAAQTLAILQTLAGLGALALFVLRRKETEYLWFSLMMLLTAADNCLSISFNTRVWNFDLLTLALGVVESGASLALVAFLVSLLRPRRKLLLWIAVASIAAVPVLRLLWILGPNPSTSLLNLVEGLLQLPLYLWVVMVVISRSRRRSLDARLLVVPVILSGSVNLFGYAAVITSELGWQHTIPYPLFLTQTPFPIHLQQVTDTLFLLAVFAILILRFTRTRSQEERFAGEVQAARSVQEYLIPELLPPTPGLAIESVYRPSHEVGGDFFQVIPDAADDSVLIVVGDVAGHGMEAGMLATLIVGGIRMAAFFTTDPERILSLLNRRMRGRGLATCLALRIERDGSATLANAGHLPPYLNGTELEMEGALPLGAIPGITFPLRHFKLAEGDALMLMTDGVAEAQDADGHLFGFERIAEMLRKGAVASALAAAAQAFGQEDDITVLTVARSMAATIS